MTHQHRTFYHPLQFKKPSGTSRGVLTSKPSWLMATYDEKVLSGVGECSVISDLSIDDIKSIPEEIEKSYREDYNDPKFPAVTFGQEIMRLSRSAEHLFHLYKTPFSRGQEGIPINGLIWMGSKANMSAQIREKIDAGFSCIKMKIGAIDFGEELSLLRYIRSEYNAQTIELRVDANGAFDCNEALDKLSRLAEFEIHSIEQPIKQGQLQEMARLCQLTPLPIALDEELIGVSDLEEKKHLLQAIQPQYIILKPSLVGGFKASQEWIDIAVANDIGWWATSALESNIGLNAIAQWVSSLETNMPQGLGTGGLYTNNISSPLKINEGRLWYQSDSEWDLSSLAFH